MEMMTGEVEGQKECIVDWWTKHCVGETPGVGRKRLAVAEDWEAMCKATGHFQVLASSQMDNRQVTLYLDFQLHPLMREKIGRKKASEPRMSMQLALLPPPQQQTCGDLPHLVQVLQEKVLNLHTLLALIVLCPLVQGCEALSRSEHLLMPPQS